VTGGRETSHRLYRKSIRNDLLLALVHYKPVSSRSADIGAERHGLPHPDRPRNSRKTEKEKRGGKKERKGVHGGKGTKERVELCATILVLRREKADDPNAKRG